ncbi:MULTISPECIES: type III secretion protein [unclassified Brenneria]|uniref:type III secretion protein n=1 Tax=unclassified Brenneria TaxID=2634434 RepID=UPI0018F0C333|nr:type III secretion protein [Brenneria sp. L3-3C-1]MBJ7220888.1 type III secretion protein [Brenneria sp. L3-3C-1]MEE3642128.1 type III secretion protein [Brenneria sp. L3_3C_1]
MKEKAIPLNALTWWVGGCVLQSDASWNSRAFFPPDMGDASAWIHVNAQQVCRHFHLPLSLPQAPVFSLMHIGRLSASQRKQILRLMALVCQPPRPAQAVTEEQGKWCRRLAKALRPGLWLPDDLTFIDDDYADTLTLLRACYGERCWPRLRLLFPRPWTTGCRLLANPLPGARLNTLCDALIWKAAAVEHDEPLFREKEDVNQKDV